MPEQLSEEELQHRVDNILLGLVGLGEVPEVTAAAFYAKPPWKTQGEQDVDLLIVTSENLSDGATNAINQRLGELATGNLPIDAWVLTSPQLELRMRRIAGVSPKAPPILRSTSEWQGFGFVPIVGSDYLSKTITECYAHPEAGGPIPPSPTEHKVFE